VLFKSLEKIIFGSKKKHPLEPHRPYEVQNRDFRTAI